MATRERPVDRGRRRAREDVRLGGREIRAARTDHGLSLRAVAAAAGSSPAQILRIERGEAPRTDLAILGGIAAVVGIDVRLRSYPGPDALRDAGQIRLLDRLRARLPNTVEFRTEVPLPIADDLRAWDAWLSGLRGPADHLPVEGETRVGDLQALLRRVARKQRDADEAFLLVVVADTRANRLAISSAQSLLDSTFPIRARAALGALAEGRHPGGSALVLL